MDPEAVQIELNSEKSDKNVTGAHHHTHEDDSKLKKQLKLFKILTIVGFILALIFLIVMIAVAATEEEKIIYQSEDSSSAAYNYDTWEQIVINGTIPSLRLAHGSATYNKEMLIIYGMSGNDTDDTILSDIWSYSPSNKTWTNWKTTGDAPSGRYHFASTVIDDYLYMHGGYLNFEGIEESDNQFYRLNLKTKTWENLTITDSTKAQPTKRGAHEIVDYNGQIYLFGGSDTITNGDLYNDLWSYNISTKIWTEIKPTTNTALWPSSRLGFNFYFNENVFWLFGGTCDSTEEINCDQGQQNDLWKFYPLNKTWEEMTPTGNIPQARRASHSEITISNHTFLFGGVYIPTSGAPTMMNDMHVYDADTNRWIELHPEWPEEQTTKIITVRFGHTVEEIDNKLYIFGGRCGNPKVAGCNDLWVYTPPYFAQAN